MKYVLAALLDLFPYWWLGVLLIIGLPIERWFARRREARARERLKDYGWDDSGRIPPPMQ